MIICYEGRPGQGKSYQAIRQIVNKYQERNTMQSFYQGQFPLISDTALLPVCPKCDGDFETPVVIRVGESFQLVHQCKLCSAAFALVPVTTFGVYELPSRDWQTAK